MIQYSLRCSDGHGFDSWFQSAAAFDTLQANGHVTCAICGSSEVEKDLMAPRVSSGRRTAAPAPAPRDGAGGPSAGTLRGPASPAERALARLRAHVEATSDYVGPEFAREARAMHLGEMPERAIWGEAKPDEARQLLEDGVPVAPLPFGPKRKVN
ncbi:DUF1178 family protein [Roseivivax sp. CAU 1761]